MVTVRTANNDIVLASASPRRLELLEQIGWSPMVLPVDIDESVDTGEAPTDYCLRMAAEKSVAAQQNIQTNWPEIALPIITADTIVVVDNQILGKPANQEDALLTLIKLSGREHQVYSALSVYAAGKTVHRISANSVKMAHISRAQMTAYIATGEPMDKAGAYGIQGFAAIWIEKIIGSYSSIMGLPLFETTAALDELGIQSPLGGFR